MCRPPGQVGTSSGGRYKYHYLRRNVPGYLASSVIFRNAGLMNCCPVMSDLFGFASKVEKIPGPPFHAFHDGSAHARPCGPPFANL